MTVTSSTPTMSATAAANAEIMRTGYAAFAKGDLATLETLFAPDAIWHEPGNNPISGAHAGWPAVAGLFVAYLERSQGTFAAELLDVLANDTFAVSVAHVRGEHSGRTLDQIDHLHLYISDGLIREARVLYQDQAQIDAFFA